MAKKPTQAATQTATVTLADIVAATKGEQGFMYAPREILEPLVESGDVIVNHDQGANEQGWFMAKATDKALGVTAKPEQAASAPKFQIEENVAIPERKRNSTGLRAGRTPIYPFDQLEIGQSFFVPNEGDKSAHKSMASSLAGANVRWSEEVEGKTRTNRKGNVVPETRQTRKFVSYDTERTITVDGKEVVQKGARIFRVALDA